MTSPLRYLVIGCVALLSGCTIHLHTDRVIMSSRSARLAAPVAFVGSVTNHVERLQAAQVNMVDRVEVSRGY